MVAKIIVGEPSQSQPSTPRISQKGKVNWVGKTVQKLNRYEQKGGSAKIAAYALATFSAALLSLSLVGIPIVVLVAREWKRQHPTVKKLLPQPTTADSKTKTAPQARSGSRQAEQKAEVVIKPTPKTPMQLRHEFKKYLIEHGLFEVFPTPRNSIPIGSIRCCEYALDDFKIYKKFFPLNALDQHSLVEELKLSIETDNDLDQAIKEVESWNQRENQLAHFRDLGRLVNSKEEALVYLQNSLPGTFCMWCSKLEEGTVRFLQKLPGRAPNLADVQSIKVDENLYEKIASFLSREGQEAALKKANLLVSEDSVFSLMEKAQMGDYVVYQAEDEKIVYAEKVSASTSTAMYGIYLEPTASKNIYASIHSARRQNALIKSVLSTPVGVKKPSVPPPVNDHFSHFSGFFNGFDFLFGQVPRATPHHGGITPNTFKTPKEELMEARKAFLQIVEKIDPSLKYPNPNDISFEECYKIYKKASLKCHPDRNPGDEKEAKEAQFKELSVALAQISEFAAKATGKEITDNVQGWKEIDEWLIKPN